MPKSYLHVDAIQLYCSYYFHNYQKLNFIFYCSHFLSLSFCVCTEITCRFGNIKYKGGVTVRSQVMTGFVIIPEYYTFSVREKCPHTEFFLVPIFLYSVRIQENTNQKKLRIWTLFTQ